MDYFVMPGMPIKANPDDPPLQMANARPFRANGAQIAMTAVAASAPIAPSNLVGQLYPKRVPA